jgi:hypothetical protein
MKTYTYLFEYYYHTEEEIHAEYEDFDAPTLADALTKFALAYPHGRVINTYVQVNKAGELT